MLEVGEAAARGGPDRSRGRGGCEGFEMGQSVPLAAPEEARRGQVLVGGLRERRLGSRSRGPGNTCPPWRQEG